MKSLSEKEIKIFARQLILKEFSKNEFQLLQNKKVVIIGMGGIGCPIAQYLISSGVKNLSLIDYDKVELSNLNRQILFNINNLGEKKVIAAKNRLIKINPYSKINAIVEKINLKNIDRFLKDASIVIDSTDNWSSMRNINEHCVINNIPLLSCSIIGYDGQIILFKNNPNKHLCLNCVYPDHNNYDIPRCDTVGVLGTAAGLTGLIGAQITMNFLTKNQKNSEKLIMINSKALKIENIELVKNKKCPLNNPLYLKQLKN